MALSAPRTSFGIHSFAPYYQASGKPYGILRVLGGSTLTLTGEQVELPGGSSPYAWDSQDGVSSAEISLKVKEIPDFMFKILLGADPTTVLDDAGNVTVLENVLNESVVDAVTGVASVGVKSGSEADLKFGKYIVEAVSPSTVDVYGLSNVDFRRGVDKDYVDDSLKITPTPLTITTGVAVEVPGFGVELTGGSGTIGMTAGDTAEFEISPPSLIETAVDIGALGACIPEFGAYIVTQKQKDGSQWAYDCFRVSAIGFPFGMEEKSYNEAEITAKVMFDSSRNKLVRAKYVKPLTGCV